MLISAATYDKQNKEPYFSVQSDGFTFGTAMFKVQLLTLFSTDRYQTLHTSARVSDKRVGKVLF